MHNSTSPHGSFGPLAIEASRQIVDKTVEKEAQEMFLDLEKYTELMNKLPTKEKVVDYFVRILKKQYTQDIQNCKTFGR